MELEINLQLEFQVLHKYLFKNLNLLKNKQTSC